MATVPNRAIFFTAWTDPTTSEFFPVSTNALITDQPQLDRIVSAQVAWLDPTFDKTAPGTIGGTTPGPAFFTSINGGPLAGLRNRVINGRFDIWQRGADNYPDMWLLTASGGTTPTLSRQDHTPGQTDVTDGGAHYMRWVAAGVASSAPVIRYRAEDVRTLAGQSVGISFAARADVARTTSFRVVQAFGSGGSAGVFGATYSFNLTTDWQRFEIPAVIPSVTGKTIGAGSYLELRLQGASGDTDQRIDLDVFQIEPGGIATPFEVRPPGLEVALCQRYLQIKTVRSADGSRHIPLTAMQAAPSVTVSVGTAGNITKDGFELSHSAAADCTVTASAEL